MQTHSDLNSILLEGKARNIHEYITPVGNVVARFSVDTRRNFFVSDEPRYEVFTFEVEAWWRLGQACLETLTPGCGVRIVGRLASRIQIDSEGLPHNDPYILAEHVEFKPKKSTEPPVENPIEAAAESAEAD